jgi:hypothetical protein
MAGNISKKPACQAEQVDAREQCVRAKAIIKELQTKNAAPCAGRQSVGQSHPAARPGEQKTITRVDDASWRLQSRRTKDSGEKGVVDG